MLVLLNLSAAFDKIDPNILLQRLQHVKGIKGLCWFKVYLSNRFQFVNVNEESSSYTRVSHGVLQDQFLSLYTCMHWDWNLVGPNANLMGAGGFKIVMGWSERLKVDSASQDCW